MNLVEVKYKRTVNLGNYESCTLEMTGQVSENDDLDSATVALMGKVHQHLNLKTQINIDEIDEIIDNGNIKKTDGKEVHTNEQVEVTPSKKKKKSSPGPKKVKASKKKAVKKDEKKEEPKKDKPKGKVVPYNRENAVHKQELIALLDKKYGANWNQGDKSKEIKETSGEMLGEDFMDSEGKVLDSFLNTFFEKVESKC